MTSNQVDTSPLVARIGLYDREGKVYANKLVVEFYSQDVNSTISFAPPEIASKSIISNAFANLNIDELSAGKKIFIKLSHQDILSGLANILPKDKIIVELIDSSNTYEFLLDNLKKLRSKGYKIALNDFFCNGDNRQDWYSCDYILLDTERLTHEQIQAQFFLLKDFHGTIIANNVNAKEQFEWCKAQDRFSYFQGDYFCQPDIFTGKAKPVNHSTLINLLTELNQTNVEVEDVVNIIASDPTLGYRILLIVNSAYYSGASKISSLQQAVVRIGLQQIKNWLLLLNIHQLDNKPSALIELTIIRARMCELIAKKVLPKKQAECFTVGLLSTLDALLDQPLCELIEPLPLGAVVRKALLLYEGRIGQILSDVINYQKGNFSQLDFSKITNEGYSQIYINSVNFAQSMMRM